MRKRRSIPSLSKQHFTMPIQHTASGAIPPDRRFAFSVSARDVGITELYGIILFCPSSYVVSDTVTTCQSEYSAWSGLWRYLHCPEGRLVFDA